MLGPAWVVRQLVSRLAKSRGNEERLSCFVLNLGGYIVDVAVEDFVLFRESVSIGPLLVVHGQLAGCSKQDVATCGVGEVQCEQAVLVLG